MVELCPEAVSSNLVQKSKTTRQVAVKISIQKWKLARYCNNLGIITVTWSEMRASRPHVRYQLALFVVYPIIHRQPKFEVLAYLPVIVPLCPQACSPSELRVNDDLGQLYIERIVDMEFVLGLDMGPQDHATL